MDVRAAGGQADETGDGAFGYGPQLQTQGRSYIAHRSGLTVFRTTFLNIGTIALSKIEIPSPQTRSSMTRPVVH